MVKSHGKSAIFRSFAENMITSGTYWCHHQYSDLPEVVSEDWGIYHFVLAMMFPIKNRKIQCWFCMEHFGWLEICLCTGGVKMCKACGKKEKEKSVCAH